MRVQCKRRMYNIMDIEYHIQKGNKEFLLMKVYSIANR